MKNVRVIVGLVIAALGVALWFMPDVVANMLNRPASNVGEAINLRATWGGSLSGIGAFIVWRDALKPYKISVVGLLMWGCIAIAAARAVGFALDGIPGFTQWFWLVAEIVIAIAAALAIRHWRESS